VGGRASSRRARRRCSDGPRARYSILEPPSATLRGLQNTRSAAVTGVGVRCGRPVHQLGDVGRDRGKPTPPRTVGDQPEADGLAGTLSRDVKSRAGDAGRAGSSVAGVELDLAADCQPDGQSSRQLGTWSTAGVRGRARPPKPRRRADRSSSRGGSTKGRHALETVDPVTIPEGARAPDAGATRSQARRRCSASRRTTSPAAVTRLHATTVGWPGLPEARGRAVGWGGLAGMGAGDRLPVDGSPRL